MRMASGFDDMTLEDLRRRRSYKWRLYPPDVVPAFVAEMDFRLAPPLASAIAEAAAIGDCGYAWRDTELAAALSGFAQRRFSWTVDPGDVVLIPDVMAGVVELLRMVCEPGDGVVINTPAYPPFFSHIEEARCRVVEAPLAPGEHRFELDLEALEAAFLAGARVFLLSNPHNPTGRVFSRPELQGVAELAERYDVLVFSDEIHAPLVLPGAVHVPFLTLDELIDVLARNRQLMDELLTDLLPEAGYAAPEGGYLAWVDCRRLGIGDDPARAFLDRGRVALRAGRDFGAAGEGFVRVTMGTSAAILGDIVQRMRSAVD